MIKRILSPFEWFVDHLHTPIPLSTSYRPQKYNLYDYKVASYSFMYLKKNTHTWFVKYSEDMKSAFEKFQVEQTISKLPENIKWCKFFISKRISYIISCSLYIHEFERIKYLSKTIKIK
ncbi:hypothetical protein H5410_036273 [Solanum commersonii]|uniref:Uncharacterized protein n=1 Tax=Solanum commersonii TaxID=4109 RepID=A0A9J5Y3Q5_SOLCO|nr:hypothetical protein H5410_036273 [Solanum commersonii]